jgi:hypothetical protein
MKGKKEFEIERGFTLRILLRALRVVVASALTIKIAPGDFVNLLIRLQLPHISFKLLLLSSFMKSKSNLKEMVGARGFEPPTTATPLRCATRLRYAPNTKPALRSGPAAAYSTATLTQLHLIP